MYLIFTDLDGTLLDFDTYSFDGAKDVLSIIKEQNIPIVAVTSKTVSEVYKILNEINIRHPFVVENGGGIFFPDDYPGDFPRELKINDYYLVSFAQSAAEPVAVFNSICRTLGIGLKGFSQLTSNEIASLTGLSVENASKAKDRHFSEPFILPQNKSDLKRIKSLSRSYNYKIVVGGRFAHLIPLNSGKGNAVKFLINFYQSLFPEASIHSIGLGDSPNDYDFLSVTNTSILIRNKGKIPKLAKRTWIKSQKNGVEGWAEELKKIILPYESI